MKKILKTILNKINEKLSSILIQRELTAEIEDKILDVKLTAIAEKLLSTDKKLLVQIIMSNQIKDVDDVNYFYTNLQEYQKAFLETV